MADATTAQGLLFNGPCDRPVLARFDQPDSSTDGGAVLLPACDARFGAGGLTQRLADCLRDTRDPSRVSHTMADLVRQRVYGLCAGYADCNDAARLVDDPMARLVLGRDPVTGAPVASQPTLSRFENALDGRSLVRMGHALCDAVLERHCRRRRRRKGAPVRRITIDMDPTDDHTHGAQQLTMFNAHYGTWCYLPVAVFVTFDDEPEQCLVGCVLRPGDAHASDGAEQILARLVGKLRTLFPDTALRVRLDGGYATPELFDFFEARRLQYVVAMGSNPSLKDEAEALMAKMRERSATSGETEHDYTECRYASDAWSDFRRVVIKAEVVRLAGRLARDNPRFVVTNLKSSARHVYEDVYCQRALIENRIKELIHGLSIDRTSCTAFLANQARVLLTCAAYALMQEMRLAAKGTSLAGAQVTTLRERLVKLAVWVQASTRRIVLHLPEAAPWRQDWCAVAKVLGAKPG